MTSSWKKTFIRYHTGIKHHILNFYTLRPRQKWSTFCRQPVKGIFSNLNHCIWLRYTRILFLNCELLTHPPRQPGSRISDASCKFKWVHQIWLIRQFFIEVLGVWWNISRQWLRWWLGVKQTASHHPTDYVQFQRRLYAAIGGDPALV